MDDPVTFRKEQKSFDTARRRCGEARFAVKYMVREYRDCDIMGLG